LFFSVARVMDCAHGTEGEGFEPSNPCGLPVFKTGGFNRSPTPPGHRTLADFSECF
jgi:hypothetical protein